VTADLPFYSLCHASFNSPLGTLYLLASNSALCALAFESNWPRVRSKVVHSSIHILEQENEIIVRTRSQLSEYFAGLRRDFDIPLQLTGTQFQLRVWNSLLQIPYGEVWNYEQQARWLNHPKALRAVGSANGMNPAGILIPCHRVISKCGNLGGYSGGSQIKYSLLKLEQKNSKKVQINGQLNKLS
jgi:methylated-DNA-[protein]-cysteine S-methyltransferase